VPFGSRTELLDQFPHGIEAARIAAVCPRQLFEQWQPIKAAPGVPFAPDGRYQVTYGGQIIHVLQQKQ